MSDFTEAKRRFHDAHPGLTESQHRAMLDAALPRMVAWLNRMYTDCRFKGDHDAQRAAYARSHTHRFEVQFAEDHDAMAAARYRSTFVAVVAPDATTASLVAAQMAGRHGIPTATIERSE